MISISPRGRATEGMLLYLKRSIRDGKLVPQLSSEELSVISVIRYSLLLSLKGRYRARSKEMAY